MGMTSQADYYRYERARHVSSLRELRRILNDPDNPPADDLRATIEHHIQLHQDDIEKYDRLIQEESR